MSILAWIEDQRRLKLLNAPKYNHPASDGSQGLWTRCDNCGVILYIKHLKENQRVCFGCGFHLQMNSQERIDNLIDVGTWRPFDETLSPCDPLEFRDQKQYTERLREAQERTGLQDAIQTGTGMLDGIPIALGVMDFHFMGGSMGSAVGEKITRLIEYATQEGLTLILVCASGGARMQEGILSLMQMAKISAALQVYQSCANLLYISVLTSPTTGGVTASFAMLGDLIFAEPKALIGFAGRRVIEQTLQEQLPDDFQTSEYLLHHGLLDLIVPRSFLKQALSETITLYKDAPLKLSGIIPHGVQQTLSLVSQEKVRRNWLQWKKNQEDLGLSSPFLTATESYNNQLTQTPGVSKPAMAPYFQKPTLENSRLPEPSSGLELSEKLPDPDNFSYQKNTCDEATKIENEILQSTIKLKNTAGLPKQQMLLRAQSKIKGKKSEFSYREILLSFHTMFQFMSDEFVISTSVLNSLSEKKLSESERSSVTSLTAPEAKAGFNKPAMAPQNETQIDFLNKAILLASHETIQWRAFYMTSKLEPKKQLLDKFKKISEESDPQNKLQAKEKKGEENYFFYKAV